MKIISYNLLSVNDALFSSLLTPQNSYPDDSGDKTSISISTQSIGSKEEKTFYFQNVPVSRSIHSSSQTSNESLFERRPPKRYPHILLT